MPGGAVVIIGLIAAMASQRQHLVRKLLDVHAMVAISGSWLQVSSQVLLHSRCRRRY